MSGSSSNTDGLLEIFELREDFMKTLQSSNPSISPDWPLDLSSREDQQYVRDIALRGVEEMFEALQHLKNWKPHRTTQVTEFNRGAFLEEVVDAFNYFFSLLILVGFDADDLYEAYKEKDSIIHDRIKSGY